jgi:tRNA threonylcarbamoyl adenosine modification protein YeaZ
MTCLLALDCTVGGFTLALRLPNGQQSGVAEPTPRSSSQLHPALDKLLKDNQITPQNVTHLALTCGPGSFTGCRIGMAFAAGWQLAWPHVVAVGLPSLAVVARQVVREGLANTAFRVLLDAAGGTAYGQDFNAQGQALAAPFCLPLAAATHTPLPIAALGLPLLEAAKWHLAGLKPTALLAAAEDAALHQPLEIIYLKPLSYRTKTDVDAARE